MTGDANIHANIHCIRNANDTVAYLRSSPRSFELGFESKERRSGMKPSATSRNMSKLIVRLVIV